MQAGRSLIEVMVVLAITLVLVAAALAVAMTGGRAARHQEALARLDENGQLALDLLSAQLRMAGFTMPQLQGAQGRWVGHHGGPGVRACDHGFVSTTAADLASLVCQPGSSGPAAFAVAYEADTASTWPGTAGTPTDCAGNQISTRASSLDGVYTLADNRFFIRINPQTGNPTLYCAGSGGSGFVAQPLIDGVEHLVVRWGVVGPDGVTVERYLDAAQLDADFAHDAQRWSRVVIARLCVVLATPPGVSDEPAAYRDCEGRMVRPVDAAQRRVRRSFSVSVQLRNRAGGA